MPKSLRTFLLAGLPAVLFVAAGCDQTAGPTPPPPAGGPGTAGPGGPGMGGPGMGGPGPGGFGPPPGGGPSNPELKRIMEVLAKGPNSLTPTIGRELKESPPPWDAIRGRSAEYAELAAEMTSQEPPKGSKESWDKHSVAFAEAAAELDRAAASEDLAAATAAHERLAKSCMACHREHRAGGPGMMGGPGRGGPGMGRGPGGFGPQPGGSGPPPGEFGPPPGDRPEGADQSGAAAGSDADSGGPLPPTSGNGSPE